MLVNQNHLDFFTQNPVFEDKNRMQNQIESVIQHREYYPTIYKRSLIQLISFEQHVGFQLLIFQLFR